MYQTKFKEANYNHNEVAFYFHDSPEGELISSWKLTLWERIRLLFTGRIWMQLTTFNKPYPASTLTTIKKDLLINEK